MGAKEPYRFRVLKCEICDILSVWSVQLVCMFCAWCVVYLFDFVVRQNNEATTKCHRCLPKSHQRQIEDTPWNWMGNVSFGVAQITCVACFFDTWLFCK